MRSHKRQLQPFTHRWAVGYPPAWVILIALNTGMFVAQTIVNLSEPGVLERGFGLSDSGVAHDWYWQFITYTFLHGSWWHLAGNMLLLYFAGREVEALLGVRHFLGIYFGGGLAGSLAQWMMSPLPSPMLGASACVLATLIAFTTILPELENTWFLFFVIPIRMKTKHLARVVVGVTLFFIAVPQVAHLVNSAFMNSVQAFFTNHTFNVAHYAHLGGCLFGWLYVKQLGYGNPLRIQRYFLEKRRQEERRKHMSSGQFIVEEIDPILEKISRDGIQSLTRHEKRLLEMGRDKIEKTRR